MKRESNYVSGVGSFALRLLFFAFVTSSSTLAESPSSGASKPGFSNVQKSIQQRVARYPSISVEVARKGEVLWEEGFGWADRENRVPATEHTMYYTASVTKSFTATALMFGKSEARTLKPEW